ncbi:MAG: gamma-glutamyl-gamma-aminobutyrate hydrolase family protein [Clostridia bacterium]|nr:gamma-glutamyl-gamma-aminobutyrate hydrolase family protein [Clostridia bacterium]
MKKICVFVTVMMAIMMLFTAFTFSSADSAVSSDKPMIGIAWRADTDSEFFTNVCRAVEAAGGEWVMLDQVRSYDLAYDETGSLTSGKTEIGMLDETAAKYVKCNGWQGSNAMEAVEDVSIVLFTGGEDISPTLYYTPEQWHGIEAEIDYNAERDVSDYLTMAYCLDNDIPLMGFCRGAQMLGVISGGEVIQDIPSFFEAQSIEYDYTHRNQKATPESYRDYASHDVEVARGTRLYDIVGTDTLTGCASWHHQALMNVDNTRLVVSGCTETNGIQMIEAVERTDKTFALGLQFHPEAALVKNLDGAANKDDYMTGETALSIFRYIVDEAWQTLPSWSEGAKPKTELMNYMAAITNEESDSYIPVENRIAVFDLDGTLMCETYPRCFEYMVFVDFAMNNPDYTPTEDVLAVAQEIVDTKWQEKPSGISTRQAAAAAVAYAGMTPAELGAYVKGFMSSEAEGFTGLTRGEAFYKPMVEVVDYLRENDFTIYIVTATERNIVRAIVGDTLGIAPANVIGTEYGYTATGQGDTADGDYTFKSTDKVVFDGNYYGENAKMSKVDAIVREIGQQPVLAFGNSSGDVAMCEYVVTDNPCPALSYIVLADDEVREWGNTESAQAKIEGYNAQGIGTISMRDDFATIYGDHVEKNPDAATVAR